MTSCYCCFVFYCPFVVTVIVDKVGTNEKGRQVTSGVWGSFPFQAQVVQRLDNAIPWINRYPVESANKPTHAIHFIRWMRLSTF